MKVCVMDGTEDDVEWTGYRKADYVRQSNIFDV